MVQVAVGAEIETPKASTRGTCGAYPPPQRLGSLEERRMLPQLGLGRISS